MRSQGILFMTKDGHPAFWLKKKKTKKNTLSRAVLILFQIQRKQLVPYQSRKKFILRINLVTNLVKIIPWKNLLEELDLQALCQT